MDNITNKKEQSSNPINLLYKSTNNYVRNKLNKYKKEISRNYSLNNNQSISNHYINDICRQDKSYTTSFFLPESNPLITNNFIDILPNKITKLSKRKIKDKINYKRKRNKIDSNFNYKTINNNEINPNFYNGLINISNNKKNAIKNFNQQHIKHYSDLINTITKFSRLCDSNTKKKNKQLIKHKKIINHDNNINIINKKNMHNYILNDTNNILNELKQYELNVINSINNISYYHERDEIISEYKIKHNILGKFENDSNLNNKINKLQITSFIQNYNSYFNSNSNYNFKNYICFKILENTSESNNYNIKNENIDNKIQYIKKLNKENSILIDIHNHFNKSNHLNHLQPKRNISKNLKY